MIGLPSLAPAADDLVVTIAELLENPSCGRPVRATLRTRSGSFDASLAVAFDGTGGVGVPLMRAATENFREAGFAAARYELWLEPFESHGDGPSFLARRVVPL